MPTCNLLNRFNNVNVTGKCRTIMSQTQANSAHQRLILAFTAEILDKLKARDFNATNLPTYDFSTLYTTLPHNLMKDN